MKKKNQREQKKVFHCGVSFGVMGNTAKKRCIPVCTPPHAYHSARNGTIPEMHHIRYSNKPYMVQFGCYGKKAIYKGGSFVEVASLYYMQFFSLSVFQFVFLPFLLVKMHCKKYNTVTMKFQLETTVFPG